MLNVGIGEYVVSSDPKDRIITYALGSCVALIIHCTRTKKTALAHIVLPQADRPEQYAYLSNKPSYFANMIVPKLVNDFLVYEHCTREQLIVTLVGGALAQNVNDTFKVGLKNVDKIKSILEDYHIMPKQIDVGGYVSRTVEVNVENGKITITKQKMLI